MEIVESRTFESSWRIQARENEYNITIELPSTFIGRLIGKEGKNIKTLQSDTRARLEISRNPFEGMTEVKIFGSPESVENAKTRINKLLDDTQRPRNEASNRSFQDCYSNAKSESADWNESVGTRPYKRNKKFTRIAENADPCPNNDAENAGFVESGGWGTKSNEPNWDEEVDWCSNRVQSVLDVEEKPKINNKQPDKIPRCSDSKFNDRQSESSNRQTNQFYERTYVDEKRGDKMTEKFKDQQSKDTNEENKKGNYSNDHQPKNQFNKCTNDVEKVRKFNDQQSNTCNNQSYRSTGRGEQSSKFNGQQSKSSNNQPYISTGDGEQRSAKYNDHQSNKFDNQPHKPTGDAEQGSAKINDQQTNTYNNESQRSHGAPDRRSVKFNDHQLQRNADKCTPLKPQAASFPNTAPSAQTEVLDFTAIAKECDMMAAKYWSKYPPVTKCFYKELPEVKSMTPTQVAKFRLEHNNIMVERPLNAKAKTVAHNPVATFFQAFHNYPGILELIEKVGFEKPSPIQSQSWPIILSGEDLIGIAQTGTGKTLAFLLPALIHIDNQSELRAKWGGPIALVLAPTRELAIQIEKETNKYHYKDIKAVCLYGGVSRDEQIRKMKDGADIIIATPGRLDDLVLAGYVNPDTITYVVLDEADRMLDMGFEPQIRKTLYKVRPTRQTVMTSATWPSGVRRLAQSYMQNPVQVCVGSLDLVAVHSVKQTIVLMEDKDDLKFETFEEFIKNIKANEKVLVFAGKKAKASFLSSELVCMGIDCSCIHGDMEQSDREQSILDMMDNTSRILIATDIVSRGIDIENVTHVVNYDFPRNIEEYVHRVGRTGRAGRTGESISFFTWSDARHAMDLIGILEEASQEVPGSLRSMAERYARGASKRDAQNQNRRKRY